MLKFQKILVPVDFTDASKTAVEAAADLAKLTGGSLALLHVYTIPLYSFPDGVIITSAHLAAQLSETAQKHLDAWVEAQRSRALEATGLLMNGAPAEEILKAARSEKADVIVVGTHGRRGVARALLGSVAEKVLRASSVPVLAVHSPSDGD